MQTNDNRSRTRSTNTTRRRKSSQGSSTRRTQGSSKQRTRKTDASTDSRRTNTNVQASQSPWDLIRPWIPLVTLVLLTLLLLFGVFKMVSCVSHKIVDSASKQEQAAESEEQAQPTEGSPAQTVTAQEDKPAVKLLDEGRITESGEGHVTFAAFGDNLANDNILSLADGWAGETGDGVYNFSPLYDNVREEIKSYDIAFVNQETTLGGLNDGNFDWAGYPSYNTPDTMADAVVEAGFRVINTNSNHTYDWWTTAIEHAQQLWNGYDSVLTIGSYQDQQDRDTIRVVECNGVRVAFLSYSYGQNGYELSDLPNDYYAVPFTEEALYKDVTAARKVADVVVVYLHAGTEYSFEPDETEVSWAQACANNNVDLVIASHVHVIQPMRYLERADGKQMLAVYGLGDFVSGYEDYPETILSGEFSCEFVVDDKGAVSVENVVWHPLIEHREDTTDTVYLLRDYSTEMANNNYLLRSLDSPYDWIIETTRSVIGDDFSVDVRHMGE